MPPPVFRDGFSRSPRVCCGCCSAGWAGLLRRLLFSGCDGGADGFLVACVAVDPLTVDVTSGLAGGVLSIQGLVVC